jgi:hypothetical protein
MKVLALITFAFALSFAIERYSVYDVHGKRISTFEAEPHELPEKTRQIKDNNPHRKLYISSMQKGRISRPAARYHYKAETGAYIEASRKETFSICPDKEIQGTWISEYSVALNEENCLTVRVPNLAGTIQVLFLQNNSRADTIQVLVEQSYIPMGDYSHKVWVSDLEYERHIGSIIITGPAYFPNEDNGRYESRSYSQPLIVDKTKLTMGDAMYYHKIDTSLISHWTFGRDEYKGKKLEESNLPLIDVGAYEEWRFANERSKKEDLDTAYIMVDPHSKDAEGLILLGRPSSPACKSCTKIALDTTASGYRSPFEEEWFFLMRAGASTRYFWGDEEDEKIVSRYAWVRPIGLKPVAKLLPNKFGLYDIVGVADENVNYFDEKNGYWDSKPSCATLYVNFECQFVNEIGPREEYIAPPYTECMIGPDVKEWKNISDGKCVTKKQETRTQRVYYDGLRLLRKTPKLHKLEKL